MCRFVRSGEIPNPEAVRMAAPHPMVRHGLITIALLNTSHDWAVEAVVIAEVTPLGFNSEFFFFFYFPYTLKLGLVK